MLLSKFSQFGWKEPLLKTNWCVGGIRTAFNSNKRSSPFQRRRSLAPVENVSSSNGNLGPRVLVKPLCFTLLVGGCSFAGAAIWQYENMHRKIGDMWRGNFELRSSYSKQGIRSEINQWWNSLSDGQRMALGIIGANVAVFGLWRVPSLRGTMVKYFCSNPSSSGTCWPMLLSTFSHYSPLHLLANMYVLYTFSTSIVSIMGKEQFLAFYLTSGTVSSFISYSHKVWMRIPSMSLGASGAIMGVLGAVCTQVPNAQLAIIMIPWFTFSAHAALKALILMDTTGLILRWQLFDHAAHLGGALFGIGYMLWGNDLIWKRRETIMRGWQTVRPSK